MRVKLDENFGLRGRSLLEAAGHDVSTVASERLWGIEDEQLAELCRLESRTLITMDTDFANILRFPPERYPGIVVLRVPEPVTLSKIESALSLFAAAARGKRLAGLLWIVTPRGVREYDPKKGEN